MKKSDSGVSSLLFMVLNGLAKLVVLAFAVYAVLYPRSAPPAPADWALGERLGFHLGRMSGEVEHFLGGAPWAVALLILLTWGAAHLARFLFRRAVNVAHRIPGAVEGAAHAAGAASSRVSAAYRAGRDGQSKG